MLAMIALFGALGAGIMADAFMATKSTDEGDEADTTDTEEDSTGDAEGDGSMFDFIDDGADLTTAVGSVPAAPVGGYPSGHVEDGMPVSDDIPDTADQSVTLAGGSSDDILSGGNADDQLSGGLGSDQLTGRGGDDVLSGGAGRDHLDGGAGDDRMTGGSGDDTMVGGDGHDRMTGGAGHDSLAGQSGDDLLRGGSGHDTLHGGEGDDTLDGGMGRDWLTGGDGNDLMVGGGSQDTLDGGAGDDTLWGGTLGQTDMAVDFLNGGGGNDTLHLGAGDIGTGGDGADAFVLDDIYPGGPMAEIGDYNPDEDQIVVMYDPTVHASPDLQVVQVPDSNDVTLTLDGVEVAMVRGGIGLDISQVTLRAA